MRETYTENSAISLCWQKKYNIVLPDFVGISIDRVALPSSLMTVCRKDVSIRLNGNDLCVVALSVLSSSFTRLCFVRANLNSIFAF